MAGVRFGISDFGISDFGVADFGVADFGVADFGAGAAASVVRVGAGVGVGVGAGAVTDLGKGGGWTRVSIFDKAISKAVINELACGKRLDGFLATQNLKHSARRFPPTASSERYS